MKFVGMSSFQLSLLQVSIPLTKLRTNEFASQSMVRIDGSGNISTLLPEILLPLIKTSVLTA